MGIFTQDPSGFVVPALLVAAGAVCGAWLRWLSGVWLNPLVDSPTIGTLAVNLAGGFLMGAFLAWTNLAPGLSSGWRLLIATGFLGGLTTFSAFTGELLLLVQQGRAAMALLVAALHGVGSLAMAASGFYLVDSLIKFVQRFD